MWFQISRSLETVSELPPPVLCWVSCRLLHLLLCAHIHPQAFCRWLVKCRRHALPQLTSPPSINSLLVQTFLTDIIFPHPNPNPGSLPYLLQSPTKMLWRECLMDRDVFLMVLKAGKSLFKAAMDSGSDAGLLSHYHLCPSRVLQQKVPLVCHLYTAFFIDLVNLWSARMSCFSDRSSARACVKEYHKCEVSSIRSWWCWFIPVLVMLTLITWLTGISRVSPLCKSSLLHPETGKQIWGDIFIVPNHIFTYLF